MGEITKESVRDATKIDLINKLNKYGKCALIRPTGFGKTWLLTDLIKNYENVLYLYPAEVIKNTVVNKYVEDNFDDFDEETKETMKALSNLPGVTLMTYAKLILLKEEDFAEMDYDLVICDECHRLGGTKTLVSMGLLQNNLRKAHFVGATATPNRGDSFDVVSEFYDNRSVFEYTLHDAFQDGLLKVPYYCYCSYDIETDLKEAALTAGEKFDDVKVWEVLKKQLIEISNIYNMPNIIKTVCNEYAKSVVNNYYKFIVFFSNFNSLNENTLNVKSWYQDAFPECKIRELIISSEDSSKRKNVKNLTKIKPQENTIDLIYCVNMLNMGYHVNDITGIMMYRGTKSDIIYIQQLGRALSSGSNAACIVFDVVDNLHRKAVFKCEDEPYTIEDSENLERREKINNIVKGLSDETGDLSTELQEFDEDISWIKRVNVIESVDLHAVGNMATYRELIAKAVAEPMLQRCREAFEAHFRRWCKINNVPYPISDSELRDVFKLDKEEFVKYFKGVISSKSLSYPMGDAKKLIAIGKKKSDGIPMEIFAKWKNVSIKSILDLLGVA